jgi:ubiquinone/menaquinone biosynthesis C-methylase UbiE
MSRYYNEFWNKYRNQHLEDFGYKWPLLKKIIPYINDQKILDFGCGMGRVMQKIRKISPKNKFIGVDVSEAAIEIAKKKHPWANFYSIQDGDKLPFKKNYFKLILATDVIEHVFNTEFTFSELHRILKKDGKILITTPYHGFIKNVIIVATSFEKIFDPTGAHIRFYTKKSLFSILEKNHLRVIKSGYYGRFYPISRSIYIVAQKDS